MIKAQIGDDLLVFGLSDLNIERLKAGNAMLITLDEVGLPGWKAFFVYGTDEKAIADYLHEQVAKAFNQRN